MQFGGITPEDARGYLYMQYTPLTAEGQNPNAIAAYLTQMLLEARKTYGDIPIELGPNGVRFPMGLYGDTMREPTRRAGERYIKQFLENEAEGDAFLAKRATDKLSRTVRANVLLGRAEHLRAAKKFSEAATLYLEGATTMIGSPLPVPRVRSQLYMSLDKWWDMVDLVSCFNGAAFCLFERQEYTQALIWLAESLVVFSNLRLENRDTPQFDWKDCMIHETRHHVQLFKTLNAFADVFLALGNTAASVNHRWRAFFLLKKMPDTFKTTQTENLGSACFQKLRVVASFKHPHPSLIANIEVVENGCQVQGSWKKIHLARPGGLTSRMGCGVFVYDGYLYAVGGQKAQFGPYYHEFWRLNLSQMDHWESLPRCPMRNYVALVGFSMAISTDAKKAFYFTGSPILNYFDLEKQEWHRMTTTFQPDNVVKQVWPFDGDLVDFAALCVGESMYVFGGWHSEALIGSNLLLELDIRTKVWRRLSGTRVPKPSLFRPGPRTYPSMWTGKDGKKIYVMYGAADRMRAADEGSASDTCYAYSDFWSWDIQASKWTREKLVGNYPSPRSEMAVTYNPVIDKVLAFGGYSPFAPTIRPTSQDALEYSYYADTFFCDLESNVATVSEDRRAPLSPPITTPQWKHVLTRGFPAYRAQAHLVADAKTGRTFLFSGYASTEFSPTSISDYARTFSDIWELKLNITGGHFEEVDLEEEARTAKAGPWQRCFSCGSAGPWKKCGGSCNGRVFFCGNECLKEGWKEHKAQHHCRKVAN